LLKFPGSRSTVPNQATVRALEPDIVSRLARFFPEATPVRIPIRLSRSQNNGNGNSNANGKNGNGNGDLTAREQQRESENVFFQDTVIEFGTAHEVLFVLDRPLEFADRVLVESNDGSLHAEAFVVAVQYHLERTAVAVRFLKHVPNWIVKS
jgi:hypothetical protein